MIFWIELKEDLEDIDIQDNTKKEISLLAKLYFLLQYY